MEGASSFTSSLSPDSTKPDIHPSLGLLCPARVQLLSVQASPGPRVWLASRAPRQEQSPAPYLPSPSCPLRQSTTGGITDWGSAPELWNPPQACSTALPPIATPRQRLCGAGKVRQAHSWGTWDSSDQWLWLQSEDSPFALQPKMFLPNFLPHLSSFMQARQHWGLMARPGSPYFLPIFPHTSISSDNFKNYFCMFTHLLMVTE